MRFACTAVAFIAALGVFSTVEALLSQDFNSLTGSTSNNDNFPAGSSDIELTNTASKNVGGAGLDFVTYWTDTRGNDGPVVSGSDSNDFIGVNSFTGSNAPGVAADGTSVQAGVEQNFEFNDGDGLLELRFESVDVTSLTTPTLCLNYWIAADTYESPDSFKITLDDGTNSCTVLDFGETELEANVSPDDGTANWKAVDFDIDSCSPALVKSSIVLKIGVDTNAGSENIFVDDILFAESCSPPPPPPPPTVKLIGEIQGAGHISPCVDEVVQFTGVVTAVAFNGYYVQDDGDGDDLTSDGIFVYTTSLGAKPAIGNEVNVTGTVREEIPGGAGTGNLSITRIESSSFIVASSGNPLPDPVVIGTLGRIPPNEIVISDSELPVNLQEKNDADSNPFNPDVDGIDFYEAIEGMLVLVVSPVLVSPTRTFNQFSSEFFTLPSNGDFIAPSDARTQRGGIELQPDPDNRGDQNPERVQIQIDGTLYPNPVPVLSVGTRLNDVVGVVGYSFGNYEVNAIEEIMVYQSSTLQPETSQFMPTEGQLTVASYNVLNLSPDSSDDDQRVKLASQIVNNLNSPDIIALQEIQDNSGDTDDSVTDATDTLQALVDAIVAAGGPTYQFFDVAPADGSSGGVPGGNIRNAFLYNPARVSLDSFVSLTDAAFTGTRNPLVGVFEFDGETYTVINNHLSSRFGSTPIFGGPQPFVQAAENDRENQVQALHDYVAGLLDENAKAKVMVVGDFNTFQWTNDLSEILPGPEDASQGINDFVENIAGLGDILAWTNEMGESTPGSPILRNLINKIDDDNVYTFIFDGNSQALDHFFVTNNLWETGQLDIVHVNVDFPRGTPGNVTASDHEPLLAVFNVRGNNEI